VKLIIITTGFLKSVKKSKGFAAWYGPQTKNGCPFMFWDNSENVDPDCDGERGFARYNIKGYACEALAVRPSPGGSSGGKNDGFFCPPGGNPNKDCDSSYEYGANVHVLSLDDCQTRCRNARACQSLTYVAAARSGTNCFLKSIACTLFGLSIPMSRQLRASSAVHYYKCDSTVQPTPDSRSGSDSDPGQTNADLTKLCGARDRSQDCDPKYNYASSHQESLNDCADRCLADPKCQSFTHASLRKGSNCFLKDWACDVFHQSVNMQQSLQDDNGLHYFRCASTVKVSPSAGRG